MKSTFRIGAIILIPVLIVLELKSTVDRRAASDKRLVELNDHLRQAEWENGFLCGWKANLLGGTAAADLPLLLDYHSSNRLDLIEKWMDAHTLR